MSLSNITREEILENENSTGEYKGFDVSICLDKYGDYEGNIVLFTSDDGTDDGAVQIGRGLNAETLNEVKSMCKEVINDTISQYGKSRVIIQKALDTTTLP